MRQFGAYVVKNIYNKNLISISDTGKYEHREKKKKTFNCINAKYIFQMSTKMTKEQEYTFTVLYYILKLKSEIKIKNVTMFLKIKL